MAGAGVNKRGSDWATWIRGSLGLIFRCGWFLPSHGPLQFSVGITLTTRPTASASPWALILTLWPMSSGKIPRMLEGILSRVLRIARRLLHCKSLGFRSGLAVLREAVLHPIPRYMNGVYGTIKHPLMRVSPINLIPCRATAP